MEFRAFERCASNPGELGRYLDAGRDEEPVGVGCAAAA
jgi:hypothetical protein